MISDARADEPARRRFEFRYECTIKAIPPGSKTVDLWMPVPRSGEHQTVRIVHEDQIKGEIHREPRYQNAIFYRRFEAPLDAQIKVVLRFDVLRREVVSPAAHELATSSYEAPDASMKPYLGPSAMVPLEGRLAEMARNLNLDRNDPLRAGRAIFDAVIGRIDYDKSKPGYGRGDALWACDSGTGNCTDFHSVLIGLCRAQAIPAFFEIGFSLPPERGEGEIPGYHCWAWFHAGSAGWTPVDASEADRHPELMDYYFGALSADRVAFTRGRDLTLVPPQQGPALNFFIDPYVEIDGRAHEAIEKRFTFHDRPLP